jgi:hypothetical protein
MNLAKYPGPAAAFALSFAACAAIATAQSTPAPVAQASPAPAVTSTPTFMDRKYDGRTHVMIAPYIWGPTVKAVFQFPVPRLPRRSGPPGVISSLFQVGPSQYLPKLNSAGMLSFDVRTGNFDVFADGIYLNASTSTTFASTITGPFGRVHFPITVDSSAHLTTGIGEFAAGYTIAHGHDADLSAFMGARTFPINLNFTYSAIVGKRGLIAPTGSASTQEGAYDLVWGLRGQAFFGDGHWFVPYYGDYGYGNNNESWEAYGGGGYAFNHGQTIVALWRALNYNTFPATTHVQKMGLAGPLLGYTFNL